MENDEGKSEVPDDQSIPEMNTTVTEETRVVSTTEDVPSSSSSGSNALALNMEEMVEKITNGFLSEVQPQLLELKEKTKEITKNQSILMETIQQENEKYSGNMEIEEFTKMVSIVESYFVKLKRIKNEMNQLDDRLGKLKKRSLKLKEKRQRKDQDETDRKERELALEQELTAKPAS